MHPADERFLSERTNEIRCTLEATYKRLDAITWCLALLVLVALIWFLVYCVRG